MPESTSKKIERKYLAHFLDASFGGTAKNYVRLGKDLEEFNEELNPDVEVNKNILGEQNVVHNGYEVQSEVEPFYAYSGDALFTKLADIANKRSTGDDCKTTKVDVLLKRWKNIKYSTHTAKQTIGNSGCGTTAMAMILATAIDPKITPVETSALSVKHGYRTESNGTAWSFYKFCFSQYPGFKKFVQTNSISVLKAALRDGALAVCSMNNGDNGFWTKQGHFITAIGCDDDYIYANDPNKSVHPRRQAQAKFKKCMKQAFIFWF